MTKVIILLNEYEQNQNNSGFVTSFIIILISEQVISFGR